MPRTIHTLPVGRIEDDILNRICVKLADVFGLDCSVSQRLDEPTCAYDPIRQQYDSGKILGKMIEAAPESSFRMLGVADVDLCTPILSFVFGRAELDGRCAVISLFRLRPEFYGEKEDSLIFLSRVEKEAIHEVAHTFGLRHCDDMNCVMHSSNTIEDTDVKADTFCPSCRHLLFRKTAEFNNRQR